MKYGMREEGKLFSGGMTGGGEDRGVFTPGGVSILTAD
jgi:hypothetical protein